MVKTYHTISIESQEYEVMKKLTELYSQKTGIKKLSVAGYIIKLASQSEEMDDLRAEEL